MMRRSLVALAIAASLGAGCSRSPRPAHGDASPEVAIADACTPAMTEKLGVPFVRVCATGHGAGSVAPPFWISAVPIGCPGGEHGTLRCPPVVALAQPRAQDPEGLRPGTSTRAAVTEVDTAHRLCTMRFAGRLPTRAERSLARTALGLSTVMVTESKARNVVRLEELTEWVTDKACDQPTILAPDCGAGGFPWESGAVIPWGSALQCTANPVAVRDDRVTVGVESECALGDAPLPDGARRDIPCIVRGPAADPRGLRFEGVSLTCAARAKTAAPETALDVDVAAFRCVLPAER